MTEDQGKSKKKELISLKENKHKDNCTKAIDNKMLKTIDKKENIKPNRLGEKTHYKSSAGRGGSSL